MKDQKLEQFLQLNGVRSSSMVEHLLMGRWVIRLDIFSRFLFHAVLHDWYNKGHGMCYPVCGMVHIKEPLLQI